MKKHPKERVSIKIGPELLEELRVRKAETGVSIIFMIEEAIRAYLGLRDEEE